jgi:S-adenosylmethionine decarboxylase
MNPRPLDSHIDLPSFDDALGYHVLADFYDCQCVPAEPDELQEMMEQAATIAGATIVQSVFHKFSPFGLSGVVVIAESHLAVHTWPEHKAICVDIFTCSSTMNAAAAIASLQSRFQAARVEQRTITRSAFPKDSTHHV